VILIINHYIVELSYLTSNLLFLCLITSHISSGMPTDIKLNCKKISHLF